MTDRKTSGQTSSYRKTTSGQTSSYKAMCGFTAGVFVCCLENAKCFFFSYSFGSTGYHCIYGCMFCMLLFNFVFCLFLLLYLYILDNSSIERVEEFKYLGTT